MWEKLLKEDCFNPTMVRLLQFQHNLRTYAKNWFQSTMVRLLRNASKQFGKFVDGFNPTMVRLLPGFTGMGTGGTGVFQSHNGAIAAGSG
jgi:hypothetical protein